jgi:putative transposase
MRFAFIHSERDAYPITALCRVMQVARSGYHAWAVRDKCDRRREDRVLAVHVAAAFERSGRTYESPRIRIDLQEDGMRVGRSRIARLMRENDLIARRKKSFRATPGSCPSDRVSPNRLDWNFTARAPNRKWITDVKYVRTSAGWLYLAPVIDLFSRRVVGCVMSTEQDGKLSVAARTSALEARGKPRNVSCTRAAAVSTAATTTWRMPARTGSGAA